MTCSFMFSISVVRRELALKMWCWGWRLNYFVLSFVLCVLDFAKHSGGWVLPQPTNSNWLSIVGGRMKLLWSPLFTLVLQE